MFEGTALLGKMREIRAGLDNLVKQSNWPEEMVQLDLNPGHVQILGTIYRNETPMITSKIAKKLFIKYPTMTMMVDRLESRELVRRVRSKEDRRAIAIELTPRGKNLLLRIYKQVEKNLSVLLKNMRGVDRRAFEKALNTLLEIVGKYAEQ